VFCSNIYLVQKIYLILFCEDRAVFAKWNKQLIFLDYESLFHFLYHWSFFCETISLKFFLWNYIIDVWKVPVILGLND
jgi:hypothetical protein